MKQSGLRIHITGVVQGVGFRPFVYSLARRLNLRGWVRNTSAGVDIELDGPPAALDQFANAVVEESPLLARIDHFESFQKDPGGFEDFTIVNSEAIEGGFQPISPDVCICEDCLRELYDPSDRRYRYPFINCTNCGPRFTIIEDIPYDRPFTTMASFELCPECEAEYRDPSDRRFHAQPVACPVCGPHVWLELQGRASNTSIRGDDAVVETRRLLKDGKVVAIKGLGGFHLACDATNPAAVDLLRERKLRVDKPFAVMMLDSDMVEKNCLLNETEKRILESYERPIVVLDRRLGSAVVSRVAPGQNTIGVMLPYTPLHYLLMEHAPDFPEALVMTSGNISEEPIATKNDEALERLSGLADAFLLHNRDIRTRCDDSVIRAKNFSGSESVPSIQDAIYPLRRSRGYAPLPIKLSNSVPQVLAAGAELKNAFCLSKDKYAFLSHHIGDMENIETLMAFEDGIQHLERLFRIVPEAIAYDLHPNYLASRYALTRSEREGIPAISVQHHYAHVTACMAEHGLPAHEPVIGVSFDGTGYGTDGAIWGGEFLAADFYEFERLNHLKYTPLPGGDRAVKEPWRMALSWLLQAGLEWDGDLAPVKYRAKLVDAEAALSALHHQIQSGLNAPPTSSIGRLFDAVSSIAGVRQVVNYEAQAAIEFETVADPQENNAYPIDLDGSIIDPSPLIERAVADARSGVSASIVSARFHNGLASMVAEVCAQIRRQHKLSKVILSGGVWQNMTLLQKSVLLLESSGFETYLHRLVPANDGGIALGQVAVAAHRLRKGQLS